MKEKNNLIFDIGFHKGEDTAYYLYKGYNVVAVDASEELVEIGKTNFFHEIKRGKLTLLNLAISSKKSNATPFYISENSLWNSSHKGIAEREEIHSQCKLVPSDTLLSLMRISSWLSDSKIKN